jgi:hypothetical protein
MSMLAELGVEKRADGLFGGPSAPSPTLDDLLNQVGADFTYNCLQQQSLRNQIRAVQAMPGNSVATPVSSVRGMIGDGLRALADRYFTPKPLSQDNIPGYRRIGQ